MFGIRMFSELDLQNVPRRAQRTLAVSLQPGRPGNQTVEGQVLHLAYQQLGARGSIATIPNLKAIRELLHRNHVKGKDGPGADSPPGSANHEPKSHGRASPNGSAQRQEVIVAPDGIEYTEDQLTRLVSEVKDFQLTQGSVIKIVQYETESSVPGRPISASVLPTVFPRPLFEEAVGLQEIFNELYIRVASDPDWLYSVLKTQIESDGFIAALWDVYVKVRDAGVVQNVTCGLFRSDYMIHQPSKETAPELKQVEINPYSAAGACHAERISKLHHRLGKVRMLSSGKDSSVSLNLPDNKNTESIVSHLKAAYNDYVSTTPGKRQTCVIMTVQPFNFNVGDERPIEYGMWDSGIPLYRCEWQLILERTTLTEDRTLLFRPLIGDAELEVTVVYNRAGYDPAEYGDQGRETSLRLEMSRAIKSPDILVHLTTFKTVQQALTETGVLERFLSEDKASKVRKTFMPMQILDSSPEGVEARNIATDPNQAAKYVLKPNLDGGGHNIYRGHISDFLSKRPKEEWHKYILMRLIEPPPTTGTLMLLEDLYHGAVVSELGILGTVSWRRGEDGSVEILRNEYAGWTFKTKPEEIDEMSVVKGYGCFDCPYLTDERTVGDVS